MRELKFRAWLGGKMAYSNDMNLSTFFAEFNQTYIDCEIMQYTGLKDSNGKEIYEGDIVRQSEDENEEIGVVRCDGLNWRWAGFGNIDFAIGYYGNPEIVGNIYENPDLLRRRKDK